VPDQSTKYRGIIKTDAFKRLPSTKDERTKPKFAYWKVKKLDEAKIRQTHGTSQEITDKTTDIEGDT